MEAEDEDDVNDELREEINNTTGVMVENMKSSKIKIIDTMDSIAMSLHTLTTHSAEYGDDDTGLV